MAAPRPTVGMAADTAVPPCLGHVFGDVKLDGWVTFSANGSLDDAASARIQTVTESYWQMPPFRM